MEHSEFDAAFAKLAEGYREGTYEGRRFSLIVRRSGDGRRNSLFARELDGTTLSASTSSALHQIGHC
jgi:hypothetical protein